MVTFVTKLLFTGSSQAGDQPARHLLRSNSSGDAQSTDSQKTLTVLRQSLKAPEVDDRGQRVLSLADRMRVGGETALKLKERQERQQHLHQSETESGGNSAADRLAGGRKAELGWEEEPVITRAEPVKPEVEQWWDEVEKSISRMLKIKDMDFCDLNEHDDINYVNAQV